MPLGGSAAEWHVDRALDVRKMAPVEVLSWGMGRLERLRPDGDPIEVSGSRIDPDVGLRQGDGYIVRVRALMSKCDPNGYSEVII